MNAARMPNPVFVLPDALTALHEVNKVIDRAGLPAKTRELVSLRASQINGCSVCAAMHPKLAKRAGATDQQLFTVAAWRDAPWFSDAERAALALTESVTRLADSADPVPDAIWDEAAKHYDEKELAALLLSIATINVWNRLNVSVRQVAGAEWN